LFNSLKLIYLLKFTLNYYIIQQKYYVIISVGIYKISTIKARLYFAGAISKSEYCRI